MSEEILKIDSNILQELKEMKRNNENYSELIKRLIHERTEIQSSNSYDVAFTAIELENFRKKMYSI